MLLLSGRFNPQQVSLLSAALDVVENHPADEKALVFTSEGDYEATLMTHVSRESKL